MTAHRVEEPRQRHANNGRREENEEDDFVPDLVGDVEARWMDDGDVDVSFATTNHVLLLHPFHATAEAIKDGEVEEEQRAE